MAMKSQDRGLADNSFVLCQSSLNLSQRESRLRRNPSHGHIL
jgi:hypothetical protein